ncbi:MAG: HupE/UreJ family protein [Steroidobacteraceae bacterium]
MEQSNFVTFGKQICQSGFEGESSGRQSSRITLALVANHWVTLPGSWVEPGIALIIAYVGLQNLVWRNSRHGAWLARGFGLLHGFGFAGADLGGAALGWQSLASQFTSRFNQTFP